MDTVMNREIDVKAILSHIIRGDGLNKCRICMGDTKEGQVHLEDTIMMDGEKAVTLSDILGIITGVEMERDRDLPEGLCGTCTNSAVSAWHFQRLCQNSVHCWWKTINKFSRTRKVVKHDTSLYIYLDETKNDFVDQSIQSTDDCNDAVDTLNNIEEMKKKNKRKGIKCRGLKCFDCGKEFTMAHYLNQHLKNTMKRVCTQCAKILPREKLGKHLGNRHNKIVHTCEDCYKLFDDRAQLNQHRMFNHGSMACQCTVCGHGFKSERSLRAHMYAHTLFNCTSCNKAFENRKCYLYHHLRCKEKSLSTDCLYECHDCGNTYTKKASLKMHIILKHINVLPYVCQVCGKRSSTSAHNRAHEAIHTERKVYRCHCGANMRTLIGFQMHQRIHTGEKPYECKECGERFLSASRRLDHVKRKHWTTKEMMHKCDECDAPFLRPFELKKHLINNHYSQR